MVNFLLTIVALIVGYWVVGPIAGFFLRNFAWYRRFVTGRWIKILRNKQSHGGTEQWIFEEEIEQNDVVIKK